MSAKFIIEDKALSFEEFCLSESISPKEIPFGDNFPEFNNSKTIEHNGILSTWFVFSTSLYWVWVDKSGDISFMRCKMPLLKDTEKIVKQLYLIPTEYDMGDQKGSYNAINLFGNILHVVLYLADKTKVKVIKFRGFDNSLENFYKLLSRNTPLLNKLENLGWKYIGIKNRRYTFSKIN